MLEHKIYVVFSFLSGPVVGIFGGAGPPVLRGMMSKIVSSDDQGYSKRQQRTKWIKIFLASTYTNYTLAVDLFNFTILHELGDLSRPDWSRAMVHKS